MVNGTDPAQRVAAMTEKFQKLFSAARILSARWFVLGK